MFDEEKMELYRVLLQFTNNTITVIKATTTLTATTTTQLLWLLHLLW